MRLTLLGDGHLLINHPEDLDDRINRMVLSWGSGSLECSRPFPNAIRVRALKPGDPVHIEYV